MWLLHTTSLELCHITDPGLVRYAILSHVWDQVHGEPSFQDAKRLHNDIVGVFGAKPQHSDVQAYLLRREGVSRKLVNVCAFAHNHGYEYIWTDTCCIDKTSSAELSEAINSMHSWYTHASVCYAYLEDVGDTEDPTVPISRFRASKWFTRGWTLQELVAPRNVVFLSQDWTVLGTKASLEDVIEEITGIDGVVLTHQQPIYSVSVAQRMSWASARETTRVEDRAYSLLGIFGIHMPTIYGEGPQAFVRLQEEILRRIPDQTLFAWGRTMAFSSAGELQSLQARLLNSSARRRYTSAYLFATSPSEFSKVSYRSVSLSQTWSEGVSSELPQYSMTSYGLRATLPVLRITVQQSTDVQLALLSCEDHLGRRLALVLSPEDGPNQYLVGGYRFMSSSEAAILTHTPRLFLLPPSLLPAVEILPLHILYRRPNSIEPQSLRFNAALVTDIESDVGDASLTIFTGPCKIVVPHWTLERLKGKGFSHNVTGPLFLRSPGSWNIIRLRRDDELIHITISLCGPPVLAGIWKRESSRKPPLHVEAVHFRLEPSGPRPSFPSLSECRRCHVGNWNGGKSPTKVFGYGTKGTRVRLKFADWDAGTRDVVSGGSQSGAVVPLALDIDVSPFDLRPHPSLSLEADKDVSVGYHAAHPANRLYALSPGSFGLRPPSSSSDDDSSVASQAIESRPSTSQATASGTNISVTWSPNAVSHVVAFEESTSSSEPETSDREEDTDDGGTHGSDYSSSDSEGDVPTQAFTKYRPGVEIASRES